MYSFRCRLRRVSCSSTVEKAVLPHEIRQLAPRTDIELQKDVRQVSADGACRDLQRAADFLVGFPARHHARYLDLASSETSGARRYGLGWRTHSSFPHLLARARQLGARSQAREDIVSLPQLAHSLFSLAHLHQRTGDPSPDFG